MKKRKRMAAFALAAAMVFSALPVNTLAVEKQDRDTGGLCIHHTKHTADCGYTPAADGAPCGHQHTGDCYTPVIRCTHVHTGDCYPAEGGTYSTATPSGPDKAEPAECSHQCTEESGCVKKELDCPHEQGGHDGGCGYIPATRGTPCRFVCEFCGPQNDGEDGQKPDGAKQTIVSFAQLPGEVREQNIPQLMEGGRETAPVLPDILEAAVRQGEAEPQNVSIEGVTWTAQPELDQAVPGVYRFTPVLPEEYALAEGTALPAIAVTVLGADRALLADTAVQFDELTPGGTYWFDLSAMKIPGMVNSVKDEDGAEPVPDMSLNWVPFTYTGTISAYSRDSEGVSEVDNVQAYDHSLFIADHVLTHTVSWDELNSKNMIFGTDYQSGGLDYTLRAPSAGSFSWAGSPESDDLSLPQSNEWTNILYANEENSYIKNWKGMYSWGQDSYSEDTSYRAVRGNEPVHFWNAVVSGETYTNVGFRPVLEVQDAETTGSAGLAVVEIDLNGGRIGGSADSARIVVQSGGTFTAPTGYGLSAPEGMEFDSWTGNGQTYEAGAAVPPDVDTLTAQWKPWEEQFDELTPGGTYWFDLSAMEIPGMVNNKGNKDGAVPVPDTSLSWVPFTYTGKINAYSRSSEGVSTNDNVEACDHSLFIADHVLTHSVSWDELNSKNMIFGTDYQSGGLDYTLRSPSVGSSNFASAYDHPPLPLNNEWDTILDKENNYLKNWKGMFSLGQDRYLGDTSECILRGNWTDRSWYSIASSEKYMNAGFRPVLEVQDAEATGSAGLTVVEIDLNGGRIGGSADNVRIVVRSGGTFTAPTGYDLDAPEECVTFGGWTGNGQTYKAGEAVPSDVDTLTARWKPWEEQLDVIPGGTYWFDLSAMEIPGMVNNKGNEDGAVPVPDESLNWVPFTYTGKISAYSRSLEGADQNVTAYNHSLFIADHVLTHSVSWDELNGKNMIFGTGYQSGGVDYTLRSPSVGSNYTGSDESERGIPLNNEWDTILDKENNYVKNWTGMHSLGQDSYLGDTSFCVYRGNKSARWWNGARSSEADTSIGFRPVLEVQGADTLGSGGLQAVNIDLNGGRIGGSTGSVRIVVQSGGTFTAPTGEGLTRPDGNSGTDFWWRGSDGRAYSPGNEVSSTVAALTAQWTRIPPESTPAIRIDYANEKLTGFDGTAGYTINDEPVSPGLDGALSIRSGWLGTRLSIVKRGSGPAAVDSDPQTLPIPARPAAPSGLLGVNETVAGDNNGRITGVSAAMEYRKEGENAWTGCSGSAVEKLAPGVYLVRLKATGNDFASEAARVEIRTGAERIYTLNVTAPVFDEVTAGYSQPGAKAIRITSSGNSDATVSSVGLNGDTAAFILNKTEGTTVPAGGEDTSYTIRPAAGLGAGTHRAAITVAYNDGAAAAAEVSFTVTQKPGGGDDDTPGTGDSGSSSDDEDEPSDDDASITRRPGRDGTDAPATAVGEKVSVDSQGSGTIGKTAVSDAIEAARNSAEKNGSQKNGIEVTIPVETGETLDGIRITLKADTLDALIASNVRRFAIDTDHMADFGLTLEALGELDRQTSGDILLAAEKTTDFPAEAGAVVGNRPVYSISLWEVKDGQETRLDGLNGKPIRIAIPYIPKKDEQPGCLYAVCADGNGGLQWITGSSYDAGQKAVIFGLTRTGTYGVGYDAQAPAFTDIENHWAKDHILFAASRGLLDGTSAAAFSPDAGMTRGMLVTALGRLAGIDPADHPAGRFTDVEADAYYAPYAAWAADRGIVDGVSSTAFAPDAAVSREQMAVIMKNYAASLGRTIPKTLEAVTFADHADISSGAAEAVRSMQQAGILADRADHRFDPAGTVTRAEAAAVLRRFVEITIDPRAVDGWTQNGSGQWSYYANGGQVKGWLSDDQRWYWLDGTTGKMFSGGWKEIGGREYYFYGDGSMAADTTVDGKTVGADGARTN